MDYKKPILSMNIMERDRGNKTQTVANKMVWWNSRTLESRIKLCRFLLRC